MKLKDKHTKKIPKLEAWKNEVRNNNEGTTAVCTQWWVSDKTNGSKRIKKQ